MEKFIKDRWNLKQKDMKMCIDFFGIITYNKDR